MIGNSGDAKTISRVRLRTKIAQSVLNYFPAIIELMILLTFISLYIFQVKALAQVGMSVGQTGKLVLTGKSCEELLLQREALCEWKRRDAPDESFSDDKKSCNVKKGVAKLTISECLPGFTRAYQEKKLFNQGPNCWGTALSFKGLSKKPRFVWKEEMSYWLESPLCRKLGLNEEKKVGDLINVYSPEYFFATEQRVNDPGERFRSLIDGSRPLVTTEGYTGYQSLLHSVTYISPFMVFGKDSPSKDDQFYFHPLAEVYGRPRNDPACSENQILSPYVRENSLPPKNIRDEKCPYFSVAHRCERFDAYFSKQGLSQNQQDHWKSIKALQEFQEKLFSLVVSSNRVFSKNEVELLLAMSDVTLERSAEKLKGAKINKNKTDEMLYTLEYFTAAAIRKSLEQAKLAQ